MEVDVIMLVNSKSPPLIEMTQKAINTLHQSEKDHTFLIQLMESNRDSNHQYKGCTQHSPEPPFNYNGYMLEGMAKSNNEWVVLANNDLVFHPDWFSGILKASEELSDVKSFSSFTPAHQATMKEPYYVQYGIGTYVTGWCLTVKREVFDIMTLDTCVSFWCSDNVYQDDLIKHGIKHALVRDSVVTHLGGQTLFTMGDKIHDLTGGQVVLYNQRGKV